MNKQIINTEIETVIKNLLKQKPRKSDNFIEEFYQTFKDLMPIYLKHFQKIAEEEHFQTHYMKATIT